MSALRAGIWPSIWIAVPGVIALIVFGAYVVVWNQSAQAMRKAVAAWTEDVREQGGAASFGEFKATGFPFFLRGALTAVSIGGGGWAWTAPRLFIDASPFEPDRLIFSAPDPHEIRLASGGRWRVDAPDGRASLAKDESRGWLLDVQSGPGRIEAIGGASSVSASSFLLSAAPNPLDRSRVFFGVDARGIEAVQGERRISIDAAEIALAVGNLGGARSLRAWRDTGGKVEVQRLRLEAAGAHAEFSGQLILDPDGYPAGTLKAEIVNPAPIAEILGAAGVIAKGDVASATAALSLAALAGGGRIAAPLTLEERAAHVAGVRLGKLPQVLK